MSLKTTLVAFAMAGADERRGGNADAHAADAGEIAVPGVGEIAPDGQGDFLFLEVGQARERFLRADDDDFLERRAGVELGAGGVVDAPGEIGLHFASEIGLGEGQAGAAGGAGADEAMFAGVGVDVDVALRLEETFFADFGALVADAAAMEGDAAFLVGDDDLDAVFEHGRFEQAAVGRRAGPGLVRMTSTDLSSIIAPMIFSICCVQVSLPSMSCSRPGVVCWPVIAVVLLSRMT